jgi:creatinine amidohydrolase
MDWARMTGRQLAAARQSCGGVCLVPIGSLEAHGPHLPVGTDGLTTEAVCSAAAEAEPCVVVPMIWYSHVREMKATVGAVALETKLLMPLVEAVCDEIARNGFRKIILVSHHGGNRNWLPLLMQDLGGAGKGYLAVLYPPEGMCGGFDHLRESDVVEHHAGELETSLGLHLFGDCVDTKALDDVGPEAGRARPIADVKGYTPVEWYSMYPLAYAGDARPATKEKGREVFEAEVRKLVACIRAVKADETTFQRMKEFESQQHDPLSP